jgi:iron complex outermembrane receptor protein
MKNRRHHGPEVLSALLAAGIVVADAPARAQSAQTERGVLEEIVVTARRREENLQKTPISITAFTAQSIAERSARNVADLGSATPNLVAYSTLGASSDANFYIRGVGQNDYFSNVDPGVAVYLDGIYLGRITGANLDLLDVERVEVLRGPQGTLFGRNTIGGAVSIVTAPPSETFGGTARVGLAERSGREASVNLNAPVTDTLLTKVSVSWRQQDGWIDRVIDDKTNSDVDDTVLRAQALWKPVDEFSARLVLDASRGRGTAPGLISGGIALGATSPLGVPLPDGMQDDMSSDEYLSFASNDPILDVDMNGIALIADWQVSDCVRFKSFSSYREVEQDASIDNDGTRWIFYDLLAHTDQEQYSQEFQLGGEAFDARLDWVAGLYYFHEEVDQTNGINLGGSQLPLDPPSLLFDQRILPRVENVAVYTQETWHATEQLSFTAGVRVSYEEKEISYDFIIDNSRGLSPFVPPIVFPIIPYTTVDDDWTSVTPRLGAEYQISDSVLAYFSYASGFRSGGFNGRPTSLGAIRSFDPEESEVYELGIKADLADHRLRINADVWYNDYSDVQLFGFGDGFLVISNGGDAELQGVELEISALPTERLRFDLGVGYTDNEYTDLIPGAGGGRITLDTPLPLTPEWTVSASAQYEVPLASGTLTMRADYAYRSEFYFGPTAEPGELERDYGLLNARVSWASPGDKWMVAVYGRNITDEYFRIAAQDALYPGTVGIYSFIPGPPSTYGAEVQYNF